VKWAQARSGSVSDGLKGNAPVIVTRNGVVAGRFVPAAAKAGTGGPVWCTADLHLPATARTRYFA